ncbi:MAG: cache domain-containing protein [Bacteroidales bacterium]|nr:cache domain-containing protein [Bacteroidales bacterium]
MKTKRSIRQKIILYILSVFIVFFVASVAYIVVTSRKTILDETIEKTRFIAKNSATDIEKFFESNLGIARTLSQAFSVYQTLPVDQWQKLFLEMYLPVIKANEHIYIIWDSWEHSGYIPNYTKEYGRTMLFVLRDGDKFEKNKEERSQNGDSDRYGGFKKGNRVDIWEPYLDVVQDGKREAKLMTTIASPVQINGKFMGMVGIDLELTALQELVAGVETVEGGYAFLVSPEGVIAGHPNSELISKNIDEVFQAEIKEHKLHDRIRKGDEFNFSRIDDKGKSHYMFFSPITVNGVINSWSLGISVPYSQIMRSANHTLNISLIVGVLALTVVILLLIFISNSLTKPIVSVTSTLKRMAHGEISSKMKFTVNSGDEIEEMAEALNRSIEGLNSKTEFALDIGKGKLDSEIDLLSEQDILGKSLIDMRDSLKVAKDEEVKRKEEDRKRTWANEGLAKFADILRRNNDKVQILSDEIVSNLVKYLKANQAGLFLLEEEDRDDVHFMLISAYAWDRKKFMNKRIEFNEGLVGACAMEKETIQLTEIPDDYVEITSGLGKATPSYIVLVPLKHEEDVLGVIEIASFRAFEQFEVEFTERVAQSIASTILSVRINAKTRALLEQSQQQAEEMLAQEEEMRQNMEELQATQEEMSRKAQDQKLKENELSKEFEEKIEILKQEIKELKKKK